MSDTTQEQGRSEAPTAYKLKRARERGQVARGMDLGFASGLAAATGVLWLVGPGLQAGVASAMRRSIVAAATVGGADSQLFAAAAAVFSVIVHPLALVAGVVFAIVVVFEMIQTGIVFSTQPLKPDLNRLNPARGLKRVFSVRMLIETLKTVAKFVVYSALAALVIHSAWTVEAARASDAGALSTALGRVSVRLALAFLAAAVAFAILDQLLARREYTKQMRMSRRELRRESRDREGEPRLKQRRKELHGQFAKVSQSVRGMRGADLLIVNPIHLAVGLRYDPAGMEAPKVVARGAHQVAQRLKRMAFLYGVTVIEDKPLAQALFRRCRLDQEIPELFYGPVASLYRNLRRPRADEVRPETAGAADV